MRNAKNPLVFSLVLLAAGAGLSGLARFAPAQAPANSSLEQQARAALSQTQGNLKVPGLERPVTVLRDRWGVPHIYAQNPHDLFFSQGFVAAQDRLFQMELWKRSGQGRLAEVLGPAMLARDVNARLLRYRGPLEAEYASYASDTREILEAFTAGINAYIRRRTGPAGPGLPLEFRLAGFSPEPWKPEDCLMRMAGFPMTGNAGRELYHAQLVALLGAEAASRLLDLDPPVKLDPAPGLDFTGLSPSLLRDLVGSDTRLEFPPEPGSQGSNNWTVSGKLTRSGRPMLANDPHRTLAVPSLRYIVHLVAPGWNVIGAGEPGLPGVAAGHNEHIAWGFTVFGLDQQDLYLETLDPSDPLRYKTEPGWERMRVEKEEIRIKGRPSVQVDLKFTRHGPVLWEDAAKHRALVLHWVGAEPGTVGYLASLAVDRAENWEQLEAAMARWKVPSENIVYADTEGNIGEHSIGLAPIRRGGNWTGLLPVPGDQGYEWTGFLPAAELPHTFNPSSGYVATANHKMIPEGYPYAVGFEWVAPDRARRIQEVLEDAAAHGRKLDVDDMARLQNDVVSLPARQLLRLLAGLTNSSQEPARRLLLNWNGSVEPESGAAVLYEVWLPEVERAVYHRLAPEKAWKLVEGHTSLPVVLQHLQQPDEAAFGPSPEAARDRLLEETLTAAVDKLRKLEGADPARWSWGRLHQARFQHPLDRLPGAAGLFDLGPVEQPGDGSTIDATYFPGSNFQQVAGASYREIFDLSDWDRALAVNVPGQSGQPASPHYADLLPLWATGRYFPLLYSRPAIEKESPTRLVLEP